MVARIDLGQYPGLEGPCAADLETMQFGHVSIIVTATAASVAGLSILLGFDLPKVTAWMGLVLLLLLIVSFVIEWRRRSKRLGK